jgi:hypothetical protein
MTVAPATTDLLNDRDTFKIWSGIFGNIPTLEFETPKAKGNWLEKRVFHSLCGIGFRTLAGRIRELRGLSSILYENDVLVFKPGIMNRLLVVECKFRRQGSVIEKDIFSEVPNIPLSPFSQWSLVQQRKKHGKTRKAQNEGEKPCTPRKFHSFL